MPFIHVHTARVPELAARNELGYAMARAYGECMQTSHRIVNVGFTSYDEGALARYDDVRDAPREMTVITCDVRVGRTAEMVQTLGAREDKIYRDGGRAPDWSPAESSV